jgi:hypothetical protein
MTVASLLLIAAGRSDAATVVPEARATITPRSDAQRLSLTVRTATPKRTTLLTPEESVWYTRLLAAMDASKVLLDSTMTSDDLYTIGRGGGDYIEALLMALRATGDLQFLDRVLALTELAR